MRRPLFDACEEIIHASLAASFQLRRRSIDETLARREGSWNGRPLTLETTIFEGTGQLARLHLARIKSEDGSVASLTVLGLPRVETAAPVLGLDLVAFGEKGGTVMFDLREVGRALLPAADRAIESARLLLGSAGEVRKGGGPLSSNAAVCSPAPGRDAAVIGAVIAYTTAFAAETRRPDTGDLELARSEQLAFLAELAAVKKQLRALGTLFGGAWIQRYFDSMFLSPASVS